MFRIYLFKRIKKLIEGEYKFECKVSVIKKGKCNCTKRTKLIKGECLENKMILFRWKKNIYGKCVEDKCKGGKLIKGKI